MRAMIVGATMAMLANSSLAQDGQVRITGWGDVTPEPRVDANPTAVRPAPPTARSAVQILAPAESPYGEVARPSTRVAGPPDRFLRFTGPMTLESGVISKGGILDSASVAHVVTGYMSVAPERVGGIFSGLSPMHAGPVYAVQLEGKMIWCAPTRSVSNRGEPYWLSDCFVPHPFSSYYQHGVAAGLYVTRLPVQLGGGVVRAPQVREQLIDFGAPMRMTYVLGKIGKRDIAIRVEIQSEGPPSVVWNSRVFWAPDGTASFKILDGEVRFIRNGADTVRVEALRAPSHQARSPF